MVFMCVDACSVYAAWATCLSLQRQVHSSVAIKAWNHQGRCLAGAALCNSSMRNLLLIVSGVIFKQSPCSRSLVHLLLSNPLALSYTFTTVVQHTPANKYTSQLVGQSVNHSVSQSLTQSVSQSANQPVSQSVSQLVNVKYRCSS